MIKYGSPGGAHDHGAPVSIEEANRHQLEMNKALREQGNSTLQRDDERVRREIKKARAAKARRRAKNLYDFS